MSLDKAIEHNKEYRKQYTGSKAIDPSCRNHCGCPWCEENRKKKYIVKEMSLTNRIKEYLTGEYDDRT